MNLEDYIKLFAAFGFGTILSAVLSFFSNYKNKVIDFNKEEYEFRRGNLNSIYKQLDSYKTREIFHSIEQLKLLIKPKNTSLLGKKPEEIKNIGRLYYLEDAHIWEVLDDFDYSLESITLLKTYLKLYLDFEKSKLENLISVNTSTFVSILSKIIPVSISIIFMIFIDKNPWLICLYVVACAFIALSEFMVYIFKLIDNPNVNVIKWLHGVFYIAPTFCLITRMILYNKEHFDSNGLNMVLIIILFLLLLFNFSTTFIRIDNYTQPYIDNIKKLERTTHV